MDIAEQLQKWNPQIHITIILCVCISNENALYNSVYVIFGCQVPKVLTHWGRVTHIHMYASVNKSIIGPHNGLSPDRHRAIIWNNAAILLIAPLWTNFIEFLIKIHTFSFKKMHINMSSGKRRPSCLGLNVLIVILLSCHWLLSSAREMWWLHVVLNLYDIFRIICHCYCRLWKLSQPLLLQEINVTKFDTYKMVIWISNYIPMKYEM